MTWNELGQRFSIEGVKFDAGNGGLTRAIVENDFCSGELYLHGGHLTSFQPKGGLPVLWMSKSSHFEMGLPIRGGVPHCFPWFGPSTVDSKAPSHGWARLKEWSLHDCSLDSTGATELILKCPVEPFLLTYKVTLASKLSMSLKVELSAKKDSGHAFESALHSYFSVADIHQVSVLGLEGSGFIDKVANVTSQHGSNSAITFDQETDRVYFDTEATVLIHDPAFEREIRISKSGSRSTVVWNPWIEKSRRMKDFGDDEWRSMVCVETANIGSNAVFLEPGGDHTMIAEVFVHEWDGSPAG